MSNFKAKLILPRLVEMSALFLFALAIMRLIPAHAKNPFIVVQSTTSTQNSGLYDHLLPHFTAQTGIDVRVVAVGSGQALRNAEKCDGDLLIVHSKADEIKFVNNGFGTRRYDLMYNDYVILGPTTDPANLASAKTVKQALKNIFHSKSQFASRGDNSGTHKAERSLWKSASLTPGSAGDRWYLETGLGMGATLNFAVQTGAYTLSDRATWLAFANPANHKILFEGFPPLFNQYGVVPVSKSHCPNVKDKLAKRLITWLTSDRGQELIAKHTRAGVQLFFPNAN